MAGVTIAPAATMLNLAQPINWDHPLCRGLSARWRATRAWRSGNKLRDLARANHAVFQSTTGWGGNRGIRESAALVALNGTSDYLLCPNRELNGTVTVLATVRLATVAAAARALLSCASGGAAVDFSSEVNRTGGRLSMVWGATVVVTSTTTMAVNQSYVVGYVRSGSAAAWTGTTYLNGLADGSAGTATNPNGTGSALTLGRFAGGSSSFFSGQLDDVWLFDGRAFTATDMWHAYGDIRRGSPDTLQWLSTRRYSVQGGANNFTQNLSGTLASTGAMPRSTSKALAGVV